MRNLDQQVVDASGERSGFVGVRAKHEAFLGKSCASCSIYLIQERVLEKTMALASLSQTLEPKCHTKDPHTHTAVERVAKKETLNLFRIGHLEHASI
jgi:hypothetical protein